jgi:periplasmic copper chaperone A
VNLPWPALTAGGAAVAVGAAGLIYAVLPQSSATGSSPSSAMGGMTGMTGMARTAGGSGAAGGSSTGAPITISGAYVRQPIAPYLSQAAAYFTLHNSTDQPDRVVQVATGASADAELETTAAGAATGGAMSMTPLGHELVVPAHGSVRLEAGGVHLMLTHLIGTLKTGQSVDIEVTMAQSGDVEVQAPVIPYGARTPR